MQYNVTVTPTQVNLSLDSAVYVLQPSYTGLSELVMSSVGAQGTAGTIIAVSDTAPLNPNVNDLWLDTSI